GGKDRGRDDSGDGGGAGGDSGRMANHGARGQSRFPQANRVPVGGNLGGAGLQRGADADRPDVQPGAGADVDVRLRVLSVERARVVPDFAHSGAGEPAGVRQRGTARGAGPAGAAYEYARGDRRAGGDRSRAAVSGPQEVSPEGSELVSRPTSA